MIEWAMAVFEDIFVNLKNDTAIHASAEDSRHAPPVLRRRAGR